jgi:hypothetical protein
MELDTGYDADTLLFEPKLRAGCEITMQHMFVGTHNELREQFDSFPRIMKAPDWCFTLKQLLDKQLIVVDHVIIPVRDSVIATRSRLDVGLDWHAHTFSEQLSVMRNALGLAIEACVLHDVPYTTMHFPRLIDDWEYTYVQLCKGLPELRGKKRKFKQAFQQADDLHRPHAKHYAKT